MKLIFLIFLLYGNYMSAADINATIVNGDKKVYHLLIKSIGENKKQNSESSLQKTLLNKLLLFSQTHEYRPKNIMLPKDQQEYVKLFDNYLESLSLVYALEENLEADKEKIETLAMQIKTQETPLLTTQLFYAFYTKKMNIDQLTIRARQKELANIEELLIRSLKNISFDENKLLSDKKELETSLDQIKKQIEEFKLKKERYTLLEQTKSTLWIDKKIVENQQKEALLYRKKLNLLFLEFTIKLKNHADDLMQVHNGILTLLKEHIADGEKIESDVATLLLNMEQAVLGKVETLKAQGLQELKIEIEKLWKIANNELFTINKTPISSLKLLLSLFIFIFGFFVGNIYKRYIKSLGVKNKTMSASTHTLLANMGYYAIFLITFFIVLKVLGIDLSSIALVAGALSVGIGFGLQNVISNFVSGIILMVERSVKIGDYIELDNDLRGHVVDIKMRSITVNTNSNIDIIVPNQDLIQNRVINWTMNDKIRRFEIPFGVAYATEPQKVIRVILEAVEASGFEDIYNTSERHTRIIMTGMGNSSVDFELFVWVKGKEILFPKRTISRFLVLIYNTLYENNIEIPFPQQDLHIRSVDTPLPVSIIEAEK